jgi:hypothetical protein
MLCFEGPHKSSTRDPEGFGNRGEDAVDAEERHWRRRVNASDPSRLDVMDFRPVLSPYLMYTWFGKASSIDQWRFCNSTEPTSLT